MQIVRYTYTSGESRITFSDEFANEKLLSSNKVRLKLSACRHFWKQLLQTLPTFLENDTPRSVHVNMNAGVFTVGWDRGA
jgi:hypothetical protein